MRFNCHKELVLVLIFLEMAFKSSIFIKEELRCYLCLFKLARKGLIELFVAQRNTNHYFILFNYLKIKMCIAKIAYT